MTKRLTKGSVNWKILSDSVPTAQKAKLMQFRTKYDLLLRNCMQLPIDPPKIDWKYFQDKVMAAGMVDNFQKEYEAFKVPYPPETASPKIDSYEKEVKEHIEKFKKESEERIKSYNAELQHISSLIPYDQMTMDDYRDAFPEDALDTFKHPRFWPHLPEDQLGYVEKSKEEIDTEESGPAVKQLGKKTEKSDKPKDSKKK